MAKVLVVDDEKLIVKGIRFSLEQDGMEVDCAYDGEEAVQMAREKEYDMVLLDVMLPKRDGFRGLPGHPGIFGNADYHADGQGRGHGQDSGTGVRRRRLCDQAI